MKLDVCIQGDGIVGRSLALALANAGLHVGLVQVATTSNKSEDVRAYSLNLASKNLLTSVRGWPAAAATPVTAIEVFDNTHAAVQFESASVGADALAWIVDGAAIEAELGTALGYAPRLRRLTETEPAELTVICEGKGRVQATRRGATAETLDYQQVAVACRITTSVSPNSIARQWFYQGDVVGLLPQQGNYGSVIWSTNPDNAAQLMACDADEFCKRLAAVGGELGMSVGDLMGTLSCASERQSWPLKLSQLDQWTGPGWAVAGDAAHTVHPLTGQGLNLGLGDVATLVEVLAGRDYWRSVGDAKLLRQYERKRKAAVAQMSTATDALHNVFTHANPQLAQLRQLGTSTFNRVTPLKGWVIRQAMGV